MTMQQSQQYRPQVFDAIEQSEQCEYAQHVRAIHDDNMPDDFAMFSLQIDMLD